MATTVENLRGWFKEGIQRGATHIVVVCDTYDWQDYPYYVMPDENVREVASRMEKVMEVYSLSRDREEQLSEFRAFNYD